MSWPHAVALSGLFCGHSRGEDLRRNWSLVYSFSRCAMTRPWAGLPRSRSSSLRSAISSWEWAPFVLSTVAGAHVKQESRHTSSFGTHFCVCVRVCIYKSVSCTLQWRESACIVSFCLFVIAFGCLSLPLLINCIFLFCYRRYLCVTTFFCCCWLFYDTVQLSVLAMSVFRADLRHCKGVIADSWWLHIIYHSFPSVLTFLFFETFCIIAYFRRNFSFILQFLVDVSFWKARYNGFWNKWN